MLTAKRSGRKWRVMDDTGAMVYECNSKAEADAYIAEQDSKAMAVRAELRQQYAELFAVPDAEYTGVMLALYPPADLAAQWAAIDGATQPAEQLHVTLAYLGKTDTLRDEQIAGAILTARNVAMSEEPLAAKINGVGRFNASASSDGQDVIYAVVDAPKLLKLRDHACELLEQFDAEPDDNHGYTPHMTLAYIEAGVPSPIPMLPTIEFVFDRITVAVGGKTVSFPFVEVEDEMERRMRGPYMYGESELADLCADGQTWRLFNEVAFTEPPAWMPYLPKPGEFTHQAYGKISITPERNRRFVDNFKAGVYQSRLPVDAEHQTKLSGATGWITDMRLNEDGSVDAKVEWTDRGITMIKADRFKYVSPEWYSVWQDPATETQYEDVAIGAALTTRPFFKESALRPLVANEHGIDAPAVATGNTDSIDIVEKEEQVNMAEDTKATKTEQPQVTVQQFSELQQQFNELQNRLAAESEAKTEANAKAQKFQEALDAANKRVATLESAAQRQRFGEVVGKWYGKTEDNVQTLVDLAEAFGEGTDKFNAFVAQQNAIAERLNSSEAFKEIGHNKQAENKSGGQKFEEAVAALVATGVKYADATVRVSKDQPQLYAEYVKEVRGK